MAKSHRTLKLLAGAGESDVTPAKGIQIAGDIGRYRPVEEIRAPLLAKALVLRSGGQTACLLSLDVTAVMREHSDRLRRQVAELLDTEPEAIIVHPLQSHSAPVVGNHAVRDECPLIPDDCSWLRGGDSRYIEPFFRGVLEAVRNALASLRPVTLKAARGMDGRVAFNRRFVMRDGTGRTHPPNCDPNILHCEGVTDPEVGVALLSDASGDAVAVLLHHTCHPTHGYPMRWIHPDWPGAWSNNARKLFGGSCIPMVVNGACGNIHHCNHIDPRQDDTIENMAAKLTETTERIIPSLQTAAPLPLRWMSRTVKIPLRKLAGKEVAAARKIVREHPEPIWLDKERTSVAWDWVYAVATLDLAEEQKTKKHYDYEIQVLRIGNLAIVAWPGEPFVEAQLAVKKNSPAPFTFLAHFCNDSAGYQPTREAFAHGGYETRTARWSQLVPETLEIVEKNTRQMLRRMYKSL